MTALKPTPKEPTVTDDMWEAARRIGEIIVAQRAAARQAQQDARNARRRARYAAAPKRPTPTPPADPYGDGHEPLGCLCHVAAPCGHCENLSEEDL